MSTCKYPVNFLRIPPIHPVDKDLTVTLQFSNSFQAQPSDEVVVIPVGWKSLSQRRATLHPLNRTSLTISAVDLSREDPDLTFHLLYVQDGVILGVSDPFAVGIPCDDDSLPCESLDSYTILVQPFAKDLPQQQSRNNDHVKATSNSNDEMCQSIETRKRGGSFSSVSATASKCQRSLSDAYVSTDDESFVIADMPPSQPDVQSVESQLQLMMTQVLKERDEFSKLFRRERDIAEKQEKRNEDLQMAHDALAQENMDLKQRLREKDCEIVALQKNHCVQQHSSTVVQLRNERNHFKITSDDSADTSPWQQTKEVCDEFISTEVVVKRPPPYSPPCLTSSQPWIEMNNSAVAVNRQASESQIVSRHHEPLAASEVEDRERYECPMCPLTFEEVNAAAFQQHVHSHFNE